MSYLSKEICNDQSCRRPAKIRIPRQRADHQVRCRIITLKMQNTKLGALIICWLIGRPKNSEMAYLSWVNYVSYWRRWSKMGGELVIGGS